MGNCSFSMFHDCPLDNRSFFSADRLINCSFLFQKLTLYNSLIVPIYFTRLLKTGQNGVTVAVLGNQHKAGGIPVQPGYCMYRKRNLISFIMTKDRVGNCSCWMLKRRNNRYSGLLLNNQNICIFVYNLKVNVFRQHVNTFFLWREGYF